MSGFDEDDWQRVTTWSGRALAPSDIWAVFNDPALPRSFRDVLPSRVPKSKLLEAGVAQSLLASGKSRSDALDELRTQLGRQIRESSFETLLTVASSRRGRWNNAFANLVSGRFTELVFEAAYSARLAAVGVDVVDATADRSFLDYSLIASDPAEDFSLSVNVKNAGRQMRKALEFFALEPEDTIPMATYKAFGAQQAGAVALIYVYLVDWTLLERLREAYWRRLSAAEAGAFQVMTSYQGVSRNVEDDFILATVEERLPSLLRDVGYGDLTDLPFRAISAARCHSLFYEDHSRSPYVFVKKMDTDPNVHISVSQETIAFDDLIEQHLSTPQLRASLLTGLQNQKPMMIPDPPL